LDHEAFQSNGTKIDDKQAKEEKTETNKKQHTQTLSQQCGFVVDIDDVGKNYRPSSYFFFEAKTREVGRNFIKQNTKANMPITSP